MNYTISLSEAEDLAMQSVSYSVDDWIQNMCHERARVAMDDIISKAIQMYIDNGVSVPLSRDEIVKDVFNRGWFLTSKQIEDAQAPTPTLSDPPQQLE